MRANEGPGKKLITYETKCFVALKKILLFVKIIQVVFKCGWWRVGEEGGIYVIPTLKFTCVLKLLVEQLSSELLSLNVRCVGTSLVKQISLYFIEITAILLFLDNNGDYAVIISNIAVETEILLLAE